VKLKVNMKSHLTVYELNFFLTLLLIYYCFMFQHILIHVHTHTHSVFVYSKPAYSKLGYSRLCQLPKVNSWKLLNFYMPDVLPTNSVKALKDDSVPNGGHHATTTDSRTCIVTRTHSTFDQEHCNSSITSKK